MRCATTCRPRDAAHADGRHQDLGTRGRGRHAPDRRQGGRLPGLVLVFLQRWPRLTTSPRLERLDTIAGSREGLRKVQARSRRDRTVEAVVAPSWGGVIEGVPQAGDLCLELRQESERSEVVVARQRAVGKSGEQFVPLDPPQDRACTPQACPHATGRGRGPGPQSDDIRFHLLSIPRMPCGPALTQPFHTVVAGCNWVAPIRVAAGLQGLRVARESLARSEPVTDRLCPHAPHPCCMLSMQLLPVRSFGLIGPSQGSAF